jgi:HAD superfamily hydrolase (TIGR01509 family)
LAPIELVIFDCDGVLVDSEPLSCGLLVEHLARAGVTIDRAQVYERHLGRTLASIARAVEEEHGRPLPAGFLDSFQAAILTRFERELRPVRGMGEVLDRLVVRRCVASSSRPERLAVSLRVTGLARHFGAAVFSAVEVPNGKPAPDLFLHAAARMGVLPERALVVEDSAAGVAAARAAGMRVIGFTGGGHARVCGLAAKLTAASIDALAADAAALAAMLDGYGLIVSASASS